MSLLHPHPHDILVHSVFVLPQRLWIVHSNVLLESLFSEVKGPIHLLFFFSSFLSPLQSSGVHRRVLSDIYSSCCKKKALWMLLNNQHMHGAISVAVRYTDNTAIFFFPGENNNLFTFLSLVKTVLIDWLLMLRNKKGVEKLCRYGYAFTFHLGFNVSLLQHNKCTCWSPGVSVLLAFFQKF